MKNSVGEWLARFIERERLPDEFRQLVADVYTPIAARIVAAADQHDGLFQVGICGAQASGKSTLVAALKALLDAAGLPTAVLSIDDIYRTRAERVALAERVHPLFVTRGVPGTHDVDLGVDSLRSLGERGEVSLPSFDKQIDDRRPPDQWPVVQGPVRVAILEGWCVGAIAQPEAALTEPCNALERDEDTDGRWRRYVNAALQDDYPRLFSGLDLLMLIAAPSFDVVYGWRCEQERKLRERVTAHGGDLSRVMSDAQIARFISHYERLTRHILAEMPARADFVLRLDARRRPLP